MFIVIGGKPLKKYLVELVIILFILERYFVTAESSNKSIYYFENDKGLKWVDALHFCKNMSMNLLAINNEDELKYLRSLIGIRYNTYLPWWTDAYKLEGAWKWISSGENITKFFWHQDEPNDKSGHERCIHTWGDYFDWNDNDCERVLPFICEVDEDVFKCLTNSEI